MGALRRALEEWAIAPAACAAIFLGVSVIEPPAGRNYVPPILVARPAQVPPGAPPPAPRRNIFEAYRAVARALPNPCDDRALCRGLVTLRTGSGVRYTVARGAARAFARFVAWLEGAGYKITDVGGYVRRRVAGKRVWSNHARGAAIDVNQSSRNRVTAPFPAGATRAAARFGLRHGAAWADPDAGHFELAASRGFAVLGSAGRPAGRGRGARPHRARRHQI